MDQREEDSVALDDPQQEVEQQPSDQPVLHAGSPDQMEDKEDSGEEWVTDLETDNDQTQRLSRAELYLQACRQTGAVPVSSFLHNLNQANLNLNHYGVGPLGAKALAVALQNDNVITNLELEDNALRSEGTRYLMEMLETNSCIQSLNLSNNQLHHEGADIVSKMLINNCHLKSIKLSGNNFDDSAAKHFADALKGDPVLKELDLSHNRFSDAAGQHLGHMLARNLGIEVLNLGWNHLHMHGAVALSAGLKVNSTLRQLQLAWNGFGHIEAESLGQALKQNSTLELLDLSHNHIDDEAAALLCQGLATNDALRVLKLSHNTLTNIGALTLLRTVKNNTTSAVEEIDISNVFVCEAFLELLADVRPALNVRYSVMSSVARNLSALQIFQKFLEERNESVTDFFQALDKDRTVKVSTSAFRKAVKAANVPLDQRQLEWLIKKFDENCTATIIYSDFAELS